MNRRGFVQRVSGLALVSRLATAQEKEMVKKAPPPDTTQDRGVVPLHGLKEAIHIGESDLPFMEGRNGTKLQVDLNRGIWVIRVRYQPGHVLPKHYHTGPVFAVTFAGSWYYKEYPEYVNKAGSYLYEPAYSVHTLTVPKSNQGETNIWFAVTGAILNMDEKGNVISVVDAQSMLTSYRKYCREQNLSNKKMIVIGE